ncbi:vicilin-like seed storage protein At2g18540 isoform X3 [Sceloporus undulatus]|uniref:vicilin-like seed storage protein At2g18540 isoform X3 n=1 Tax=Sceloporus undulatus TaxID=8520 RepID=UPI001C4DD731|nr:vicilin-like seed storage protein At2g18540 isoform X3 [Sceloporus undulatus]
MGSKNQPNEHFYASAAQALRDHDYNRTANQCRWRFKKIKAKFYEALKKFGGDPPQGQKPLFFDLMRELWQQAGSPGPQTRRREEETRQRRRRRTAGTQSTPESSPGEGMAPQEQGAGQKKRKRKSKRRNRRTSKSTTESSPGERRAPQEQEADTDDVSPVRLVSTARPPLSFSPPFAARTRRRKQAQRTSPSVSFEEQSPGSARSPPAQMLRASELEEKVAELERRVQSLELTATRQADFAERLDKLEEAFKKLQGSPP